MQQRIPSLIFLFAILVGLVLRVGLLLDKPVLEFDDAISLLAATGHEGEYAEISANGHYPIGEWVPAQEWKRLIEPEPGRGLDDVAADLGTYDIHPPLYFWLLHGWLWLLGAQPWDIHSLNLAFDGLTALALVLLGRRIFGSWPAGLLLGATWSLSPIAIKTSFWVRQYTLMTLLVLLFAGSLYRSLTASRTQRRVRGSDVGVILAGVAGLLTHYYFAIVVVCAASLVAWQALRGRRQRVAAGSLLGLMLLAGGLFLAFNPGLQSSVSGYLASKFQPLSSPDALLPRFKNAIKTVTLLFSPIVWGGLVGLGAAFLDRRRPASDPGLTSGTPHRPAVWTWMLALSGSAVFVILVLYFTGVSQAHTMSARYLGYISPLVAFVPVALLVRYVRRMQWWLLFCAGMLVLGLFTLSPQLAQSQDGEWDAATLEAAPAVLVDSIDWGTWPAVAQYLRPEQLLRVESQLGLVEQPEAWLDGFENGGVYVAILRGTENTDALQKQIVEILSSQYQVTPGETLYRPQDWQYRIYKIQPLP